MYSNTMTYPYKVDMWQYTSGGSVRGIEGFVDIDLMFIYD
jgi:GH25 family lysozyme M1 (1,4-beta-N-acetylmuramidase)